MIQALPPFVPSPPSERGPGPLRAEPVSEPLRTESIPEPLGTGELLWLFVLLALLLVAAQVLGGLARRFDVPAVVGELVAGILLGPSLLDAVVLVTRTVEWVEGEPVGQQLALVEVVAWIGLLLLIVLTGLETDLELVVEKAREATLVAVGSIAAPFAAGFAFAWVLPGRFVPAGMRLEFALFLAVAMSISAIPVIAKILLDMGHIRRDFAQITLAAGMINDTVGWILLAMVGGLARTGEVQVGETALTLLWLAVFLGVGFTAGPLAVELLFDRIGADPRGRITAVSTLVALALGAGAVTHALHLEAVLGAFVVGILAGRAGSFDAEAERALEIVTMGVFAPIFFATAGLRVDLGTLADPVVLAVAVGALAIAVLGKFVGAYVGARAAGIARWEGIAIGAGLNARGAMEIVVATVGLGLGVLTVETYSIVVLIAVVTSLMAPPALGWALPHLEMGDEERARLERDGRTREGRG